MNKIELKIINDLLSCSFYVPSYQRGYRWTELEVGDLLKDIDEFVPREIQGSEKSWYCLQPVVVKKRDDGSYEVIDGQQRLTTVYLILYYLNQDFVESRRDKLFEIEYATREDSKEFLKNPEIENDSCIDFYYMHTAYNTIKSWFESKEAQGNFDKNDFRSKLKFHTKIIWYETEEENPITVFTRLNIGKINLTNAELIKALFLNSSNFRTNDKENDKDKEKMRLRQLEIANEWDTIENALQNDKLWYFLSNKSKDDNRIEYIFDLMNTSGDTDPYSTFRFFSGKLIGKTEKEMKDNWEEVQKYYQRFNEWFTERELYHKIGFLLTAKKTDKTNDIKVLRDLYDKSSEMKKSEFLSYIDGLIRNKYKKLNIFDLDYEDKPTLSVLLLYNILTMLRNDCDSSYFPFDDYKLNKWNIEHIASRKDPSTVPPANRETWLTDVKGYIENDTEGKALLKKIDLCLKNAEYGDDDKFSKIYDEVDAYFNRYMTDPDSIDGISNLALLDEKTNKSYKNAVFPLKRKYIIDLDKRGGFVPICTKNVFLKYFSDYPPKISFWTQDDREKYEKDLIDVLGNYLEVNKQ